MKTQVLLSLVVSSLLFAQQGDTVTIYHKYYSTTFDTAKHYPVVVKFWLTKNMLSCKKKVDRKGIPFKPDPMLTKPTDLKRYYENSGYDRGHNMPADDNSCNLTGMKECFYYSNMSPQTHALNAGAWKTLEEYSRQKAKSNDSVLVWCGSVSKTKKHIGKLSVPTYCWKIIHIKNLNLTEAYSFKNNTSPSKPLKKYKVSLDSIKSLSGISFNPN